MALPLRRLAGLLIIAAAFGCPKSVNAPDVKVAAVGTGVQIGQVVRLDASASTDPQGRDLSFAWQFTAIPIGSTATLNDAHSATPSFTADVDGEYDVQVVVSNAFVSAAAATVKVTVSKCSGRAPVFGNAAITAKDAARPAITNNFAVGATVVLASDVSDPDNSTGDQVCTTSQNQAISYSWKLIGQPAASAASLNNTTASSPSFVADVAGTYTVRLVATDSTNRSSAPADQTFTVSTCGANAPTITSVAPVTEQLAVGKTIQMTAAPDDSDNGTTCQAVLGSPQTFSYQWSLPQLPNGSRASLNSTVAQNPSFTPDIDGDYTVRLVVVDSTGRSSAARDTPIHVPRCGNNAPVAAITAAGGGAAPSAGFIGILLQFGETVQDLDQQAIGATPVACTPAIPQTFSLRWSIVALPAGSQAQLNNPTGTNPSFTPDVAGTYTLQLVATDQSGLSSAPVTQSVVVKTCGMTPPAITSMNTAPVAGATTVNAGTTVGLTATAADPDNTTGAGGCNLPSPQTFTWAWSLVSKPSGSAAFIANPSQDPAAAPAAFTPDVANGTYQVQLVVSDSTGLKSPPGFFSVFTNSCGGNAPTITSAGANLSSPDTGTPVLLTATGFDSDNTGGGKCSPALTNQQTLAFQWTLVSRPAGSGAAIAVSTTPADGSVATFTPDVIGPYQFSVVVTDSTGLSSAPSFVTVQTSPCGSHAPQITAATATSTPTQPRPTVDTVALSGTVTDGDDNCISPSTGQGKTYTWSVASRPAGSSAVVSSTTSTYTSGATPSATATASFTPDVPGSYQFQLDVTDALGLKAAPAFASVTADSCSLAAPQVSPISPTGATQFGAFTFPLPVVTSTNCLPAAAPANDRYAWSIVSAPAGSSATLSNPALSTPSFTPDKVGSYQFALTVTNGAGISSTPVFFNVGVTTCAAANASLGWSSIGVTRIFDPDPTPNGTTTNGAPYIANPLPSTGAQVTVSAVASDPNSNCGSHVQPISYQWAIVAAPQGSHATLTSTTDPSPAFVPDVPNGTYQLSVVATDALGNTSAAPDFITIKSSGCGAGVPTVTISPADLTGTNSIFSLTPAVASPGSITASTGNTDNSCSNRFQIAASAYTYAWSISSQPTNGHGTLTSTTGASTNFEASVPGLYTLHAVSTAPSGIHSDANDPGSFLAINVKACGSNAPVVASVSTFAAPGFTTVLSRPAVGQAVNLVANTTDADIGGTCSVPNAAIASWTWSAVSLPSGSTAPSSYTAATNTFPLTPDIAGTFTYSVVATDNTGLQSSPVEVSISTAACGPVFAGIRAAATSGFLTPDTTNTVSGVRGSALAFDVPPAVTHTGTGSGLVSASGTPLAAHSYLVAITTGGALGTAAYTVATDGGAAGAPVTIPLTGISPLGANGLTLNFPIGNSYTLGDTYAFRTSAGSFVLDSCVQQPTFAYSWSLQKPSSSQATLSTLSGASPGLTPDVPGIYALQLVVTDNAGLASAPATLAVKADNCGSVTPSAGTLVATPSTANAGQSVQLTAPSIVDGNTCGSIDVQPYSYNWSLISSPPGSTAQLSSQTAASPSFIADVPNGVWQVALTITDQIGMVSPPAFIAVPSSSCGAHAPVFSVLSAANPTSRANTGDAISATVTDADNDTVACPGFKTSVTGISWTVVSAPAGSHASLVSSATVPVSDNPTFPSPTTPPNFVNPAGQSFRADTQGPYVVRAVATASNGTSTAATLPITVSDCGTHAPAITQVTAADTSVSGSPVTSRPPVGHTVALTATHTDADETLAVCNPVQATPTYAWTLISEPAGSAQQSPTGPQGNSISFVADRAGTFVWSVVATDSFGLSSPPVTVTVATGDCGPTLDVATSVTPAITEHGPIGLKVGGTAIQDNTSNGYSVTQGAQLTLFTVPLPLPGDTGATSDVCVSGGAPATELWTITSAPAGSNAVLSGASGAAPTFTADLAGTYGIQLVVTDNGGNSTVFHTTIAAGACTQGPTINAALTSAQMYSVGGVNGAPIFRGDVVKLALPLPSGISTPSACSTALSYEWSLIGRPPGSQATLSSSVDATPSFSADVAGGTYQFALVVRDGLGNASAPFFFSLGSSACGTFPPAFSVSPAIGFSGELRANASISMTAPTATDGNSGPGNGGGTANNCPLGRGFQATPLTYSFSAVSKPVGSTASISQDGTTAATLRVSTGGAYTIQVIATDANGRSTSTVQTATGTLSTCGAFPPVTSSFTLSQRVANTTPGTTTLTESPATTGSSTTSGGAAATGINYYLGIPISISAAVADNDANPAAPPAGCGGFTIPAQTFAYAWTLTATPAASHLALGTSNAGSVVFTPDAPGQYALALTTTDNLGYSTTSTLAIGSAIPSPATGVVCGAADPAIASPTGAQAATGLTAPGQKVALGSAVKLDATVTDPDTSTSASPACTVLEAQPFTYQWVFTQVPPGSAATLLAANTKNASFVPDVTGQYKLSLTATDPQGHSRTDSTLIVDAECGAVGPSVAFVGATTVRDFTATQDLTVNGSTALHLVHASASAGNSATLTPGGATTVKPLFAGVPVQLAANIPNPVPQGTGCPSVQATIGYNWSIVSQPAGSAATINNPAAVSPSFTPDVPGVYDFQLVLTDQFGHSTTNDLSIDDLATGSPPFPAARHPGNVGGCGNNPPTVVSSVSSPTPVGSRAQFDATGSQSPDDYRSVVGGITQTYPNGCGLTRDLTYLWTLTQAPPGSVNQLSSTTLINPSLLVDQPGSYTASVAVSDGKFTSHGQTSFSTVGNVTTPGAAGGAVFTSTAIDTNGLPVVAWWDNTNHTVEAARCTANCTAANATWVALPQIDFNLGPITFAGNDEPRPVSIKVGSIGGPAGGNIYVAYHTGSGNNVTLTGQSQSYCSFVVAQLNSLGTGWNRQMPFNPSVTCDPAATTNFVWGRSLSLDIDPVNGGPMISWVDQVASTGTDIPFYSTCTTAPPACTNNISGTAFSAVQIKSTPTGQKYGKFPSIRARGSELDIAFYQETDGTGAKGVWYAHCGANCVTSPTFSSFEVDTASGRDIGRFSRIQALAPTVTNGLANTMLVAVYADTTNPAGNFARVATCSETSSGICATSGPWTPSTIADAATTNYGRGLTIAADSNGLPRVAYYDIQNLRARLLTGTAGAPVSFTRVIDMGANLSPVGLSLAFSGTSLSTFLGFSSATGPQVYAGP